MSAIEGLARVLIEVGVIDIVLPFILVFAISFGILEKTKVLGKRNANIMAAAGLALAAVITINVLDVINVLVRYLAILIVTGVLIAMIYGFVGAEKPSKMLNALLVIVFAITAFYALVQTGVINEQRFLNTILLPLIILAALAATIAYILSKKEKKEGKKETAKKKTGPEVMITRPEMEAAEEPELWSEE